VSPDSRSVNQIPLTPGQQQILDELRKCEPKDQRVLDSSALSPAAQVALEFIAYYSRGGGCSNCGGLPHSATCFVGRFVSALDEGVTVTAGATPSAEGATAELAEAVNDRDCAQKAAAQWRDQLAASMVAHRDTAAELAEARKEIEHREGMQDLARGIRAVDHQVISSVIAKLRSDLASAESQLAALREVLYAADRFITNGIELGFIRMPDADCPDPAKAVPGMIRAALASSRLPSRQEETKTGAAGLSPTDRRIVGSEVPDAPTSSDPSASVEDSAGTGQREPGPRQDLARARTPQQSPGEGRTDRRAADGPVEGAGEEAGPTAEALAAAVIGPGSEGKP